MTTSCTTSHDAVLDSAGRGLAPSPLALDSFPGPECGLWYVLHTKSRQEKAVAEVLEARQVAHFLPLSRKPRYYGRRRVFADLPLFPSYLFLRGRIEDAYELDRSDRIASIIPVVNQSRLENDLRNLYLALSQGASLDLYPALVRGTRVEVRAGPFKGLQGIVDRRLANHRLILEVHALGRAVVLEIDAELLDPVKDSSS